MRLAVRVESDVRSCPLLHNRTTPPDSLPFVGSRTWSDPNLIEDSKWVKFERGGFDLPRSPSCWEVGRNEVKCNVAFGLIVLLLASVSLSRILCLLENDTAPKTAECRSRISRPSL